MTALRFVIPVRTTNPANGSMGNGRRWAIVERKRRSAERDQATHYTLAAYGKADDRSLYGIGNPWPPAPKNGVTVTLTRISTGKMDEHDGLRSALKHVVDGIAKALGLDDGSPFVTWRYAQRSEGRGVHGVEVTIERRTT